MKMNLLKSLIQEVIADSIKQKAVTSVSTLDALSDILMEMFSRHGEWMFGPDDPEVESLREKFGIPVEYIADGSFRVTFTIGNNRVLKISKDRLRSIPADDFDVGQMNQDDWTMGQDDLVTDVFPRSYEHAPDFSWIVMEEVEPLRRESDFFRFFRTDLLPNPKSLGETGLEEYATLIRVLLRGYNDRRQERLREEDTLRHYFPGGEIVRKSQNPDISLLSIRSDLKDSSSTFAGFIRALGRYNIRVSEINGENTGIARDGRLVLLDSSIFPDE